MNESFVAGDIVVFRPESLEAEVGHFKCKGERYRVVEIQHRMPGSSFALIVPIRMDREPMWFHFSQFKKDKFMSAAHQAVK